MDARLWPPLPPRDLAQPSSIASMLGTMALVVQSALHPQLGVQPRRMNRLPVLSAAAAAGPQPHRVKVQLIAQVSEGPRAGVGYSPEQKQQMAGQQEQEAQQYVGVPPPGSEPSGPSLLSRLRGPFIGVTFVASLVLLGIQSNRVYKARQQNLLDSFAATMIARLGDAREMKAAIRYFRGQLGPGRYSGKMCAPRPQPRRAAPRAGRDTSRAPPQV